jgi:hypothetical protein
MAFYDGKIEELASNLKNLESVVQGKSDNLRVVEDGMAPRAVQTAQSSSQQRQYCDKRYWAIQKVFWRKGRRRQADDGKRDISRNQYP